MTNRGKIKLLFAVAQPIPDFVFSILNSYAERVLVEISFVNVKLLAARKIWFINTKNDIEDVELTYLGLKPSILKYVNLKILRKCMSIDLNKGKTKFEIISS